MPLASCLGGLLSWYVFVDVKSMPSPQPVVSSIVPVETRDPLCGGADPTLATVVELLTLPASLTIPPPASTCSARSDR